MLTSGSVALELQHTHKTGSKRVPVDLQKLSDPATSGAAMLELPPGMSMRSLNKRPSIAPVPAMLDSTTIDVDLDTESESEEEEEMRYPTPTLWNTTESK